MTEPYYASSREGASQVYSKHVFPAYEAIRPIFAKIHALGHDAIFNKGLPFAHSVWSSAIVLLDRTIWPKLRILYGENVEPQLVRISERLGRYRDGRKLKAAMDENEISSPVSLASTSLSVATSSSASATATESPSATSSPSLTPEQEAQQTRERIESDLQNWQDKFAKAADKGAEDLEDRVREITDRQIKGQVQGVGEALVIELEETSTSELARLKDEIIGFVQRFPEEYDDVDLGQSSFSLQKIVSRAGHRVKGKAQALRSWKEKFDQETQSLVSAASESTLEVIDNIRDLGLQEIGLRWAQMEGVTYKDWSKYHEVKKSFDEWRTRVEAVAQEHEGLRQSKEASDQVEARGMATAEETAKELGRLKEVGNWKMEAGDVSDDFGTAHVPPAAVAAWRKVQETMRSASDEVIGTPKGAQKLSDAASSASSVVVGTEPGMVEQATSKVVEAASTASENASEAVVGQPQPKSESVVSVAKDKASGMASDASEAIVGTPQPIFDSMSSQASGKSHSVASALSEAVSGSSTPLTEDISSGASSVVSSVSSIASSATSKASVKVYGGAMAQKVKEQKPILDDVFSDEDDATFSEKVQRMANEAGDRFADITKAVSEALRQATSTQGTVESASSVANEQYSKALEAASIALYGSQTGAVESATSLAAEKYSQAVKA